MRHSDPLPNASNLAFVEALYSDYLRDPASVPEPWRESFAELAQCEAADPARRSASTGQIGPRFRPASLFHARSPARDGENGHAPMNGGNGGNGSALRAADVAAL